MTQAIKKLLQIRSFKRATFTFSANTAPGWRLSTALAAAGITKKARVVIIIDLGVNVGGLIIDSAPAGSVVKIVNNGSIIGASGGGTALAISIATRIFNNGLIAGGGGNGGNGGQGRHGYLESNRACAVIGMSGGAGGRGAGMSGTTYVAEAQGALGQVLDSAGKGGQGGNGGGLGQPGTTGGPGIIGNNWQGGTLLDSDGQTRYYPACGPYTGGIYQAGALGGAAGKAIQGIALVKYVLKGNVVGPVS